MDTVIVGGTADALAKALKTIREQPGKVWPVWQASGSVLGVKCRVPALQQACSFAGCLRGVGLLEQVEGITCRRLPSCAAHLMATLSGCAGHCRLT